MPYTLSGFTASNITSKMTLSFPDDNGSPSFTFADIASGRSGNLNKLIQPGLHVPGDPFTWVEEELGLQMKRKCAMYQLSHVI